MHDKSNTPVSHVRYINFIPGPDVGNTPIFRGTSGLNLIRANRGMV